jgi:HEAT repeat protein
VASAEATAAPETAQAATTVAPAEDAKPQAATEADSLFAKLTSPENPEEWEQAQSRLMELGKAAVPTLKRELRSADAFRREVAASAFAMLGSAAAGAEAELRAALDDDSIHVRANAATALCAIPEQAEVVIPALTKLLVSDDPQVRQMSAVNLSSFGEEAAPHVPQLTAVLKSAPADVLVPVVELLGRIGPEAESAAPQLQQIAFEQEGDAKQAATAALERINAKRE